MQIILVVEDSLLLLQMLSILLTTRGYDVITAKSGYDALKVLDGRHIDMVLTDLIMPGLDGLELTRKIRTIKTYQTIPILILTTQSGAEIQREAQAVGVTGWVVKPFVAEKLVALIQKNLSLATGDSPAVSGSLRGPG